MFCDSVRTKLPTALIITKIMKNYKIKSVLVPFDFSHGALNALKVADKFAIEFNAKIELLNVIEPSMNIGSPNFHFSPFRSLENYLSKSARAIENYLFKNSINPEAYSYNIEYGFCCGTIINRLKKQKFDLVIVQDNTHNYLSRLISKYNPLKIMETTQTPVIAVNKYYRIVDFKNIILPIRNLPNWYDKLPFMVSLAKQTGGKIHAVGINETEGSFSKEFKLIFDEAVAALDRVNVLSSISRFCGDDCLKGLKKISEKQNGDLIAITPAKSITSINSIFRPSLYSRLIPVSPAPIFGVKLV